MKPIFVYNVLNCYIWIYVNKAVVLTTSLYIKAAQYTRAGLKLLKQMNFIQGFAALAFVATSLVNALTFTAPTTTNYASGTVIPLQVALTSSGDLSTTLTYTAVFSCAAGSYQLNSLVIGQSYSVIPPGVFGPTTLTVTAVGCATALLSLTITPTVPNYPPNYVPVQLPLLSNPYPTLYSHFDEKGDAVIDAVAYFSNQEESLACSEDAECVKKHTKK